MQFQFVSWLFHQWIINDEIRLFDGTIGESSVLERYVAAVTVDSWMELNFKVLAPNPPVLLKLVPSIRATMD